MSVWEAGEYQGLPCLWLANEHVRLALTTDCGPRVLSFGTPTGPNLFGEAREIALDSPHGPLQLLGGHRLWAAPELVAITYCPDDQPMTITEHEAGVLVEAPADHAGIGKALTLTLDPAAPAVLVQHRLTNTTAETITIAPWALTIVPLGGVAVLPQPYGPVDAAGLLPNRLLVLWPYSDLDDPRLTVGQQTILIRGNPGAPNKVGYRNTAGWLAHWYQGYLFSKSFAVVADATYPDYGCTSECYVGDAFMEIESLGPLVSLAPGESTTHDERWQLLPHSTPITDEATALAAVRALGLNL